MPFSNPCSNLLTSGPAFSGAMHSPSCPVTASKAGMSAAPSPTYIMLPRSLPIRSPSRTSALPLPLKVTYTNLSELPDTNSLSERDLPAPFAIMPSTMLEKCVLSTPAAMGHDITVTPPGEWIGYTLGIRQGAACPARVWHTPKELHVIRSHTKRYLSFMEPFVARLKVCGDAYLRSKSHALRAVGIGSYERKVSISNAKAHRHQKLFHEIPFRQASKRKHTPITISDYKLYVWGGSHYLSSTIPLHSDAISLCNRIALGTDLILTAMILCRNCWYLCVS